MLSHPANIDLKESGLAFDEGKNLMTVYSPKLVESAATKQICIVGIMIETVMVYILKLIHGVILSRTD